MTETPTSGDTDVDGSTTTLDRRRGKMQTTKASTEVAVAAVDSLDQQLKTNAELRSGHEADLQATLDRVAALKRTIKASMKDHDRLLTDRKTARRVAATSRQRATAAEAKYDKAVLADMLRREKEHDLSAHSDTAGRDTAHRSAATGAASGTSRARTTTARAPRTASTRTTSARTAAARQSSTTTQPRTEPAEGAISDSAGSPS